jgi:pimeloyl-ACP methyl ester carboxylesterase
MATIVLIHGFFHGGWRWKEVRRGLQVAGHEVYTPTLTGLGERSHLASPDIGLDTHIQDLLNVLEYEDLRDATLVGNSYGGTLADLIADRAPQRLARVIHVDGVLPRDGECVLDVLPPEIRADLEERARVSGDGWRIPPGGPVPPAAAMPLKPAQQPVRLTRTGSGTVPAIYIHCTVKPDVDICGPSVRRARAWGWPVFELATGHVPAGSAPRELVDLLLRIIEGGGPVKEIHGDGDERTAALPLAR